MQSVYPHPRDNRYGASEDGKIWSRNNNRWGLSETWKEISLCKLSNGYLAFKTRTNGKPKNHLVHRYIWECLNGEIDSRKEINHKDKNRSNNEIHNLEVITHSENMKHAGTARGGDNPMSRFNECTIEAIRKLHEIGWSATKIATAFGIGSGYAVKICNRKCWNHVT